MNCLTLSPSVPVSRIMSWFPKHLTKGAYQLCKYCYECVVFKRSFMFWYTEDTLLLISILGYGCSIFGWKEPLHFGYCVFWTFCTAQWTVVASLLLVWQYIIIFSWRFPAPTWNQPMWGFSKAPWLFSVGNIGTWGMDVKELFASIRLFVISLSSEQSQKIFVKEIHQEFTLIFPIQA